MCIKVTRFVDLGWDQERDRVLLGDGWVPGAGVGEDGRGGHTHEPSQILASSGLRAKTAPSKN